MTSIQFTGLASGLDTSSIISELMKAEAMPQTMLKDKVAAEQTQITALQQLNTALSALSDSAASFADGSTWTQKSATSSNESITVAASSSAVPASMSVQVNKVAVAASATILPTTSIPANTSFTFYGADGNPLTYTDASGATVPLTFDSGSGSQADIAAAINATTATSNLRAVITKSDAGDVLQVVSTKTGAISNFDIRATADGTSLIGGATTNGTKADLTVNGQHLTSDSNTVTVATGVDITLGADSEGVSSRIDVADDGTSRAKALKTFIDQVNGVLTTIGNLTSYGTVPTDAGAAAQDGGVLPGDSTLRSLADNLVNTIFPAGGGTLENYGISVDRYGALTFDSDAFTAAYVADPAAVQSAVVGTGTTLSGAPLTDNFASRVQAVAERATYSSSGASSPFVTGKSADYDGSLTGYIKSMQGQVSDLNDDIAAWDDRLATKQASLEAIYTNLETTLASMQSQSSWLSSQLDSLDSGWSQNN